MAEFFHSFFDRLTEIVSGLKLLGFNKKDSDFPGISFFEQPAPKGDGMIKAEGVQINAFQRWCLNFFAGQLENITGNAPAFAGIHNNNFFGAFHSKGHIHAGRAAIGQPHSRRQAQLEESTHQNGADSIITSEQITAADDQYRSFFLSVYFIQLAQQIDMVGPTLYLASSLFVFLS